MKKQICILGSTGSIGTQALDVIRQHPDLYEAYALTANDSVEKLAEQAREFNPAAVVIADEARYEELKAKLADTDVKVYAGHKALCEIVEAGPVDMVLAALVGFAGLEPTIRAIKARKKICLANKETLVVAGELILDLVSKYHVDLLPVELGTLGHIPVSCRRGDERGRQDSPHLLRRAFPQLHPRAASHGDGSRRPSPSNMEDGREDYHRLRVAHEQGL